jgi:hypothetical protein
VADWSPVSNRNVLIWPDRDEPGLAYARDVLEALADRRCSVSVLDIASLGLPDGGDAVDWLLRNRSACGEDVLRLPTTASVVNVGIGDLTTSEPKSTLPVSIIESIADWCAARCVRDHRVWGGLQALYRDLSEWHASDPSCVRSEFVDGLAVLGIQVDLKLANGLALREDIEALGGLRLE